MVLVLQLHVGALLEQQRDHVGVSFAGRAHERRHPVLGREVDVEPAAEQQVDRFRTVGAGCQDQKVIALQVGFHACATRHQ